MVQCRSIERFPFLVVRAGKVVLGSGEAGHGDGASKTKWFLEPAQGTVLIRLVHADGMCLEPGACVKLF